MTLDQAFGQRLLIDGALGTELERMGCDLSGKLWSGKVLREAPQTIASVHQAYLEAGADCITTASYQVSKIGFMQEGLSPAEAANALTQSVRVAQEVRDGFFAKTGRRALVAASVGPYGAVLADGSEFHGNYALSRRELAEFHRARLQILAAADPDLFACETIPTLLEEQALLDALHDFPDQRAWFSFTCRDDRRVAHGEELAECALLLEHEPQVVAIGVNCTASARITPLVRVLRATTSKTILVYPNSGQSWDAVRREWRGTPGEDPASLAPEWIREGALWLGGCCGTRPADIARLRAILNAA